MSDNVSHPSHYTQGRFGDIECIEIIRREVKTLADVIKYVWRHRERNGLEDLRKAEQYLGWAIEDHVMLTHTAVVKIRDHVEPVTATMTAPADDVYRVIVDLAYGQHFAARTRLRNAIASWPTMSAALPDGSTIVKRDGRTEIEHEDGRVSVLEEHSSSEFSETHTFPANSIERAIGFRYRFADGGKMFLVEPEAKS